VSLLRILSHDVGARLRRGESLAAIEREVIERSGLSDDEQSALWLYGWTCAESGPAPPESRQAAVRRKARGPLVAGA
jgi:hypothetical protein